MDSRPVLSRVARTSSRSGNGSDDVLEQHDQVIQRLFAAGLRVQGLRRHLSDSEALEQVSVVSAELDATIRELRRTIYALRSAQEAAPTFSARVVALVAAATEDHALQPGLHLSGPIDAAVDSGVAEYVLGVLQEGLGNALRHAAADSVTITLRALPDHVELGIIDNGDGIIEPSSCPGLTAMRHYAELCAGTLSISNSLGGGTRVRLAVPVSSR
ncbi:sensor histidine kinase [Arthrobacter sp. TMS2-4]